MRKDITTDLKSLFRVLKGRGFLGASNFDIIEASLNPTHVRNLHPHVPWITRALYQRIAENAIEFDGVVGVPSGGEQFTRKLVEMIQLLDKQDVPQVWLEKFEDEMQIEDMGGLQCSARVLVIDDCIYTGNALRRATSALQKANLNVVAYVTPADLNYDGARNLPAPIISVFSKEFLKRE